MALHSAPQINLLSKQKLVFDSRKSLLDRVKKWTGITLLVYGAIVGLLLGLNVLMAQQLKGIQLAQEQVKIMLSANTLTVQQYEAISSKVGAISELMNARQEVVNLWQQLQTYIPPGCSLTEFGIQENKLRIGIRAPHMVLANQALDTIEPVLPSLGATKTVASISRSEDASYKLSFELDLKSTGKNN